MFKKPGGDTAERKRFAAVWDGEGSGGRQAAACAIDVEEYRRRHTPILTGGVWEFQCDSRARFLFLRRLN